MQSWPLSGLRYAYARANTARQLASTYALRCTRATCSRRVSHRDGSDPSVRPSDPAPRPIRIDLRVWLGVGHSDTHHTRSRASGTRRSDGIRLRSVSSRRIGNKPSMVHPSTHLKTTAPGGGEVTATAGRPQTHAAETTRPAGRYGIPHTAHHASASERAIPNSPNHHTTHVMGTYTRRGN